MGLILKKDESEHELIDGIEVIERSDVPNDLPENEVELVAGTSAEDIAAASGEREAGCSTVDSGAAAMVSGTNESTGDESDSDSSEGSDGDACLDDDGDAADDSDGAFVAPGEGGSDGSERPIGGIDLPAAFAQTPRSVLVIGAAVLIIVAVVAAIVGFMVGNGGFGQAGTGAVAVSESQLDTVIASYTYKGSSHNVTVRDAIEAEYSLDAAQNDDGTYTVPSSETVISYVRNQILVSEAEARGIEVSDDEVSALAESMLGTSDYATIAEQYGVSEDQAREIVRQNALVNKLYEQIVPEAANLEAPTQPTEPEDGDTSTSTTEYAQYIIELAGDEWDSENNAWASTDGEYYQALGDEFTGDTATYEQAITAYYVAYQEYSTEASGYSSDWTSFANGLFADASIQIYGIYA